MISLYKFKRVGNRACEQGQGASALRPPLPKPYGKTPIIGIILIDIPFFPLENFQYFWFR